MSWMMNRIFEAMDMIPRRVWGLVWTLVKVFIWAVPAYSWFLLYRNGFQMFLETEDESARLGLFGFYAFVTGLLLPFEVALLLSYFEYGDLRRVVRRVVQEYNRPEPRAVVESGANHFNHLFFCWGILLMTPIFIVWAMELGRLLN